LSYKEKRYRKTVRYWEDRSLRNLLDFSHLIPLLESAL
jgi:hypothetical protein